MLLGVHKGRSLKGRHFPRFSGAWTSGSPGREDPADGREVRVASCWAAQRVLLAVGQAGPAVLGLAGMCKGSLGAATSTGGKRRGLNCVSGLLFIDPYSRSTIIPEHLTVMQSN